MASRTSRAWRELAPCVVADFLVARGIELPDCHPSPLRAVHTYERLELAIGKVPAQRTWRTEWNGLCWLQALKDEPEATRDAAQMWGNLLGVPTMVTIEETLPNYATEIGWLLARGWSREAAECHTLLFNVCRGAIGEALRLGDRRCVASVYAQLRALGARTAELETVAPTVYCNLNQTWGLVETDEAWQTLLRSDVPIGHRFVTYAVAGGETAGPLTFPDGRGVRVPIHYPDPTGTIYELQQSPIVAFVSRPSNAVALRSLVQSTPTGFDLPPLATVELVHVAAPGEWRANGRRIRQRCFTVHVEYA